MKYEQNVSEFSTFRIMKTVTTDNIIIPDELNRF